MAIGIAGDIRNVFSAQQALGVLDGRWPGAGAPKHRAARRACQGALHGEAPGDLARKAFAEAAREARVLVE